MGMQDQVILEAYALSKRYPDGAQYKTLFHEVCLMVSAGKMIAITGVSGTGKSTLLHILGGLDEADHGYVICAGKRFDRLSDRQRAVIRNRDLGFIYQHHHLMPELSVLENIALPLLIGGASLKAAQEQARHLLDAVALPEKARAKPYTLSGGEKQRVSIARALVTQPLCVLADEPTGSCDQKTSIVIYELMRRMSDQYGTSFVVVTHNNALADNLDEHFCLVGGHLIKQPPHEPDR